MLSVQEVLSGPQTSSATQGACIAAAGAADTAVMLWRGVLKKCIDGPAVKWKMASWLVMVIGWISSSRAWQLVERSRKGQGRRHVMSGSCRRKRFAQSFEDGGMSSKSPERQERCYK